ncbi:MAG: gliding motility associated protein GldN [bacterium P3]|nr:MAG: gliding motility associated protein GldN [bacterium P3]KWW42431.1 MAG: gliding motility associated protein GldN [bacterium F083]
MKKLLFCLSLFAFAVSNLPANAQSIIDADDDHNFNNFYEKTLSKTRQAIPYAFLREDDVVWETIVWRRIDFREKFNQFFYFPIETERNTQGRVNLINTVMAALKDGSIEAFDDEDLTIPKDYEKIYNELNRERQTSIPIYDPETDEEIGSRDTVIREEFDPASVYTIRLKESWYIDKQDTRQKVRILGLQFIYNYCRMTDDGDNNCQTVSMFWIPMNDMRVRNALVKMPAYDENNSRAVRSYDDIFVDRFFDSYVDRVSNRMNRTIASYLTGTDAILESQRIEDEIFNIESDMWEY